LRNRALRGDHARDMKHRSRVAALALSGLSLSAHAASAPRDQRVEVSPTVQIHVRVAGPTRAEGAAAAKHPLVLIPGWRLTTAIWSRQVATFSQERRVIVVDPRSQGDSTKTSDGDTPEQRARDLDAVLKHLKVQSFVLLGWSQGVQDVAAYVQQFGTQSLAGIVLVDSTVSHGAAAIAGSPAFAAQQLGLFALYADDPKSYTRGMMRAIIKHPLPAPEFDALVADALKTPTAIGEAMLVADLFGVDRSPALAKFDRPTLVIASGTSQELDAQKAMAAALPHGRIEVMQDAGHAVFVDQPERFDKLLAAFLAQVDR
jgi:microsomal epoxide hydrolase